MKKRDVLILEYKVIELVPKSETEEEPDWESMKIDPEAVNKKYNKEYSWVKKTFLKNGFISLENMGKNCIIIHTEGTFVINMKFKKLFKLIYN